MNNEDIKILEEKIKIIESLCTDDCINKSTVIDPLKYALENLLTRYKQLEKENEKLNQLKEKQNVRINDLCALVDNFAYNSIPVSLVEEKIEEINKAYEDSKDENGESQYYYPDYTIRVLEELLEKRK